MFIPYHHHTSSGQPAKLQGGEVSVAGRRTGTAFLHRYHTHSSVILNSLSL